ncbi:hypothetical protein IMG5_148650 [Ichthyophthirius multifiliis]|uniref:CRAL-TRIO domain-containing protein n=1 Tax=Ichthyophthirius multifiliis TaxID=5932 RepID=G0QYC1_ICHMU|nr:hypothetical protein IMG5_148650 [Ichthyophthirius multifiliis]EGR29784.1 hypothetical protein IMG5_148650 [Ichthyophthirius multifiliis]|eukprot:XP_004031020.1 hypothetical protein IMG5_148650 [Ichthyophthirius multifiliis]
MKNNLESPNNYQFLNPPKQAYLYFPSISQQINGEGIKGNRWYFEGNSQYTDFENQEYQKFENQLQQNTQDQEVFNDYKYWNKANKMRFIQASGYNYQNTIASAKSHNTWRQATLSQLYSDELIKNQDEIYKFLTSGIIYLHGRDSRFRPIMVLNAYKLDFKQFEEDKMILYISYFLEVVINNMLLPGQVENWVIILDFNNTGLFSLPIFKFEKIIKFLQSNYRARMYKLYCVNCSNTVWIPWKAVQHFLEENTVNKVNIIKSNCPSDLFKHCNKIQVEQKFGGNAPNVTQYQWYFILFLQIIIILYFIRPPNIIQGDLESEEINQLITIEQYKQMYNEEKLKNCIILDEYIQ